MALIHFDEIAFMNYNWIVVPTAVNSMLAASMNARRNGLPSPIIFTTTAGNPDIKQGAFALDIFESAMPFTETLYDLENREQLLSIIRKSSTSASPMLYLEFSYRQLGRTDEWFREAAARSKASQDDINRDLLNIWQSSSDNAILTEDQRRALRKSLREPDFVDYTDNFAMRWYEPKEVVESDEFRKSHLILGMDTSENIGRDFTTMTIISMEDMRCNDSNTMEISRYLVSILKRFPNLVFIPERNNTGTAIIDYALEVLQHENINPFFRIYNEVVQNYGDPKYKNVDIYNYNASRVFDRTLIKEYSNLTLKGGRIDHESNKHDDQVISHLLASFLVFFGKNLHFYNVPEGVLLKNISTSGSNVDAAVKQEQIAIRQRIAYLESAIAASTSYLLTSSYQRELNYLKS